MPAKITNITHTRPVPEVVHALEGLLERARKGELRALAYCAELVGNTTLLGVQGDVDELSLPDANWLLDKLKFELLAGNRTSASDVVLGEDD